MREFWEAGEFASSEIPKTVSFRLNRSAKHSKKDQAVEGAQLYNSFGP